MKILNSAKYYPLPPSPWTRTILLANPSTQAHPSHAKYCDVFTEHMFCAQKRNNKKFWAEIFNQNLMQNIWGWNLFGNTCCHLTKWGNILNLSALFTKGPIVRPPEFIQKSFNLKAKFRRAKIFTFYLCCNRMQFPMFTKTCLFGLFWHLVIRERLMLVGFYTGQMWQDISKIFDEAWTPCFQSSTILSSNYTGFIEMKTNFVTNLCKYQPTMCIG